MGRKIKRIIRQKKRRSGRIKDSEKSGRTGRIKVR
jgi:hypothetical protein